MILQGTAFKAGSLYLNVGAAWGSAERYLNLLSSQHWSPWLVTLLSYACVPPLNLFIEISRRLMSTQTAFYPGRFPSMLFQGLATHLHSTQQLTDICSLPNELLKSWHCPWWHRKLAGGPPEALFVCFMPQRLGRWYQQNVVMLWIWESERQVVYEDDLQRLGLSNWKEALWCKLL